MLPYILLAAGGHAKVIMDILKISGKQIYAVCDPAFPEKCQGINTILESDVESLNTTQFYLANCIGSTKSTSKREMIFQKFKTLGFTFPPIIHPSAILAEDVLIEEGVQIMAGAIIQSGSQIKHNSIINTRSSIDHDCKIGQSTHLAPGVTLSGNVSIGDNCHIGTSAVVIQGVNIGHNSLVGAGSVVTKSLPEGSCFVNGR